jgi:hypothetical protein
MEEATENGKELLHSAHTNGMKESVSEFLMASRFLLMEAHQTQ